MQPGRINDEIALTVGSNHLSVDLVRCKLIGSIVEDPYVTILFSKL